MKIENLKVVSENGLNDVLYHYRRNSASISSFCENYFDEMMVVISVFRDASRQLSAYDFSDQFQAMTLNAGMYEYNKHVYTVGLKDLYLALKRLCSNTRMESGICPQQRNRYMQM